MENVVITYKRLSIVIKTDVIKSLFKVTNSHLESGGILYGFKIKEKNEYIISGITNQQYFDRVTSTSYSRLDPNHIEIVNSIWKCDNTTMYLGDWHFHPSDYVFPSSTDYNTFKNNSVKCKTSSKYLFYLIVGKKEIALYICEKEDGAIINSQKIYFKDIFSGHKY
ncbi:MAG: Mov34/MPN/PAD-1 family protein [Erysipelotrichales bacterium]|nr:Mov34/MPN/PAD-1 family protein [Erysipelotrichales bacterium]